MTADSDVDVDVDALMALAHVCCICSKIACILDGRVGEMVRNKLLNGKKLRDVLSSIHSYMQSCSQVNRCNCTQQNVTVNNMEKQETDKHTDRHAESQDSSALNITRRRIKPKPVEK